jgi:hypothetical protein
MIVETKRVETNKNAIICELKGYPAEKALQPL